MCRKNNYSEDELLAVLCVSNAIFIWMLTLIFFDIVVKANLYNLFQLHFLIIGIHFRRS